MRFPTAFTGLRQAWDKLIHGPTMDDIATKVIALDTLVDWSLKVADQQESYGGHVSYETRLRAVLKKLTPVEIKTLNNHQIAICLDQRLHQVNVCGQNPPVYSIYYSVPGARVLALSDDGAMPKRTFDRTGTMDRNFESLAEFMQMLAVGKNMGAFHVVVPEMQHEDVAAMIEKYPFLLAAPVKGGAVTRPIIEL